MSCFCIQGYCGHATRTHAVNTTLQLVTTPAIGARSSARQWANGCGSGRKAWSCQDIYLLASWGEGTRRACFLILNVHVPFESTTPQCTNMVFTGDSLLGYTKGFEAFVIEMGMNWTSGKSVTGNRWIQHTGRPSSNFHDVKLI